MCSLLGSVLGVSGFGVIVIQLFVCPTLNRQFGVIAVSRWIMPCFTLTFLCVPVVNILTHVKSAFAQDRFRRYIVDEGKCIIVE